MITRTAAELRQLREDAEGEITSSNNLSLSDSCCSWNVDLGHGEGEDRDVEVEDNKKVNQGDDPSQVHVIALPTQLPAAKPILMPSLDLKAVDDLKFPEVQPTIKDVVKHLFNQGSSLGYSSNEQADIMAPKQRVLGEKKGYRERAVKQTPNLVMAFSSLAGDQSITPPSQQVSKRKGKQHAEGHSRQKRKRVLVVPLAFQSSGL